MLENLVIAGLFVLIVIAVIALLTKFVKLGTKKEENPVLVPNKISIEPKAYTSEYVEATLGKEKAGAINKARLAREVAEKQQLEVKPKRVRKPVVKKEVKGE